MKKIISASLAAAIALSAVSLPALTKNSPYSVSAVTAAELNVPANLNYSIISENKIKLYWDAVKGADGYVIYKYLPDSDKWVRLKSIKNNYVIITGLEGEKIYYYKVAPLKKSNKKYYRGKFSEFIKIKTTPYNSQPNTNYNGIINRQQSLLISYYRENLAVDRDNPLGIKSCQAFIADAQSYGGYVMLVDYNYSGGRKTTHGYYVYNDNIVPIGNGLMADSESENCNSAYFAVDQSNGEYYIVIEDKRKNSHECTYNKISSGNLYSLYKTTSLSDLIYFINDESADMGMYYDFVKAFKRCGGEEEIVIL